MHAHSVEDARSIASPETGTSTLLDAVPEARPASPRLTTSKDAKSVRPASMRRQSSSRWRAADRRRSSASEKLYRGRVSDATVVPTQAEMWLMSVSDFVELERLGAHQTMRAQDKLVRWVPSMRHIFFVSHQWTSFDHHVKNAMGNTPLSCARLFGPYPEVEAVLKDATRRYP